MEPNGITPLQFSNFGQYEPEPTKHVNKCLANFAIHQSENAAIHPSPPKKISRIFGVTTPHPNVPQYCAKLGPSLARKHFKCFWITKITKYFRVISGGGSPPPSVFPELFVTVLEITLFRRKNFTRSVPVYQLLANMYFGEGALAPVLANTQNRLNKI